MNSTPPGPARVRTFAASATAATPATAAFWRNANWLLLLAAAGISASLVWDFSWESTVGVDLAWTPPHAATYLAIALAGGASLAVVMGTTRAPAARESAVRLGRLHAPLGAWLALWGALAFPTAVLFDRWWQSAYGMGAGLWHPPQILKAIAFFAVASGAWLASLNGENRRQGEFRSAAMFAVGGGLVLTLITIVTLMSTYANRQHSASFYKIACGTYPIVLVALTTGGRLRWSATVGCAVYTALLALPLWLLPLVPAKPEVGPIYHRLDHLMPPPFPLLLIVPAVCIEALLRQVPWPAHRGRPWPRAVAAGLTFFIPFIATQWLFAEFLLTDLADHWFFAGGGRHWPFFLKIDELACVSFWGERQDPMNLANTLVAAGLAVAAARIGLWIGAGMARLRR